MTTTCTMTPGDRKRELAPERKPKSEVELQATESEGEENETKQKSP